MRPRDVCTIRVQAFAFLPRSIFIYKVERVCNAFMLPLFADLFTTPSVWPVLPYALFDLRYEYFPGPCAVRACTGQHNASTNIQRTLCMLKVHRTFGGCPYRAHVSGTGAKPNFHNDSPGSAGLDNASLFYDQASDLCTSNLQFTVLFPN